MSLESSDGQEGLITSNESIAVADILDPSPQDSVIAIRCKTN
ncbi:hypothetical protein SAMN02745129_4331 [Ferrimonas marina]|uniref:Uncharacterized protein n=1 Tax=Ferrimonas marina TaxID=299255 RepID=A0A1M5YRU3_9GAMM|nr:hypothetical protein SAMN02745129_4331 [Ferrimonas marina]